MISKDDRMKLILYMIDYEVRASWWASYVCYKWVQELSGSYFAWKARTKVDRYLRSKEIENIIKNEK